MKKTITLCFSAITLFFSFTISNQAFATNFSVSSQTSHVPAVYSYWAGWSSWSDTRIPDIKFDGLFLAFALLHPDGEGSYYTDYSGSNNFQNWDGSRNYWNDWWLKYWPSGSRAHVSYGGDTNHAFRSMIINATDQQLDRMAGEIKANIAKYSFDGVDLDIEHWWIHSRADNEKFALHLAKLVKILRISLDNDPATHLKPIMIAVGMNSANANAQDTYGGTMNPFFTDKEAVNAISNVMIMSYNTGISNFYSRLDLIDIYLNQFKIAGVPAEKLVVGIQPCESNGMPPAQLDVVTNLGQYVKQGNYSGLFLWGIGTGGSCGQYAPGDYIKAMQNGLGLN